MRLLSERRSLRDTLEEERSRRRQSDARADFLQRELLATQRLLHQEHELYIEAHLEANDASKVVRTQVADYLDYVSRVRAGTLLTTDMREVVGLCAGWVRNGLDIAWAKKTKISHDAPGRPSLRLVGKDE
jgi:hypothetical protein